MYTVRRHLSKGENFGHFQIRTRITDAKQGEVVEYINPDTHNITFVGCSLFNRVNQANKILEGGHKNPCAWLICDSYIITEKAQEEPTGEELRYNPREAKNWILNGLEVADKMTFNIIRTYGTKLFTINQ
jgi:hypothetical protein